MKELFLKDRLDWSVVFIFFIFFSTLSQLVSLLPFTQQLKVSSYQRPLCIFEVLTQAFLLFLETSHQLVK